MEKNVLKDNYIKKLFELNSAAHSKTATSVDFKKLNYYIIELLNNKQLTFNDIVKGVLEFKFATPHSICDRAKLISRVVEQNIKNTLVYIPNVHYDAPVKNFKNVKNVAFHESSIIKSQWHKNILAYNATARKITPAKAINLSQTFMLLEQIGSEYNIAKMAYSHAKSIKCKSVLSKIPVLNKVVSREPMLRDFTSYHSSKHEVDVKFKAAAIALFGGAEKYHKLQQIATREVPCDDANRALLKEALGMYGAFASYVSYCNGNLNNKVSGDYGEYTFKQLVNGEYKYDTMVDGAMTMGATVKQFNEYLDNELIKGLHLVQTDVRIPNAKDSGTHIASGDTLVQPPDDLTSNGGGVLDDNNDGLNFDDFGGGE